jgi:hypothetical protein
MFGFFKKSKKENEVAATPVAQQAGEGQADQPPYAASRLGLARHVVESRFMHEYFFTNPTGFIDQLTEPYGLVSLYCEVLRDQKARRIPYYNTDFAIDTTKMDNGDYLVIAELPAPEFAGLCYRMYFLFDGTFNRTAYFTVEREEGAVRLYLWDKDANRTDIGTVETGPWKDKEKPERDAELQMVKEAYNETFGLESIAEPEEEPASDVESGESPEESEPATESESDEPVEAEPVEGEPESGEAAAEAAAKRNEAE